MTFSRSLHVLPILLLAGSLAAQAPGDTGVTHLPSPWRFGIEAGGGIVPEHLSPQGTDVTVGGAYACLGLADAPGTEIKVTGCATGFEWVHDANGADYTAVFTEPRFALVGSRHASRASWEGGILMQIGYGWRGAARDSLLPGDVQSSGFFWSPGLFVSRLVPGPDGQPRWSFIGRIGGFTLAAIGVARYF